MTLEVRFAPEAEHDLEDIYDYIAKVDSPNDAERMIDRLLEVAEKLASFPDRGSQPKELRSVGIREYRLVIIGSYRVIYRVIGEQVFVHVVADGRRDMQTLLERRLLGGT